MLTTLLIDDEQDSREALRLFLTRYCPNVQIVAEAASVADAVTEIGQHHPDLIFLDINMPHENGFVLFEKIPRPEFQTIFVTAYDEYALQAIKQQALDYILKPINITELMLAVNRAQQACEQQQVARRFDELLLARQLPAAPVKIELPTTNGFVYMPVTDIIRCEAEGSYTLFHFTGRKPMIVCKTLGAYESILKEYGFVRVHHRHLVNLAHVEQYQRGRGGLILMSDKKEVLVSQRKKDDFLRSMKGGIIIEK